MSMRKTNGPVIRVRRVEKLMLILIMIVAILTPIAIVYTHSTLASTNIDVAILEEKIEEQENINSGLSMQLDELASLSNIQNIAKEYGLSYNNNNIIVIE